MKISRNTILKISSTVFFLFILGALILILGNPSRGYELSIYGALPPLTWVLLVSAIVGGIIIVVYQVLQGDEVKGKWGKVGLSLILLSSLIIILLPALRDYAFYGRGDNLLHFGHVGDTLASGYFSQDNVYPVTHIMISGLSMILNIPAMVIMRFIGPLFYILFVLFSYLLAKQLLAKEGAALLATASSTVLFAYYYIEVFPMGFSFMTFPLILYLYFKSTRSRSAGLTFLLILCLGLTVIFHPAASLALTLCLVILTPVEFLYERSRSGVRNTSAVSFSVISLAALMLWVWDHFALWQNSVVTTHRWFQGELLGASVLQRATEGFGTLNLGPWEQLEFMTRQYGHLIIGTMLALVTIWLLWRNKLALFPWDKRGVFTFSCLFLLTGIITFAEFFRQLTGLTAGRPMWLLAALLPPLVGLALYQIGGVSNRHRGGISRFMRGILVISLLTICSLIGIFGVYSSPMVYSPNPQVTYAEIAGAEWLIGKGSPETTVTTISTYDRLERALLGMEGARQREHPRFEHGLPDHFGYDQYEMLSQPFKNEIYLSLSKYDRLLYTEGAWARVARFDYDDFAKLAGDPSVDKLYTSGEVDVWYIWGEAQE